MLLGRLHLQNINGELNVCLQNINDFGAPMQVINGIMPMGKPRTVVHGNMSMHISTDGELVRALMPSKDVASLVKVIAELTQNVMDWAFSENMSCQVLFEIEGKIS